MKWVIFDKNYTQTYTVQKLWKYDAKTLVHTHTADVCIMCDVMTKEYSYVNG